MKKQIENNSQEITRKDALKKIGSYGKYAALTALGTYMILNPQESASTKPSRSRKRILIISRFNVKYLSKFLERYFF